METTPYTCHDCQRPIVRPAGSVGTGWANYGDVRVCYECSDARERHELLWCRVASAYVSTDGRSVTTWPGGYLGEISKYREHRIGFNHGDKQARFRVRDVHGNWWQGRGAGKGMHCTLREMKTPRR